MSDFELDSFSVPLPARKQGRFTHSVGYDNCALLRLEKTMISPDRLLLRPCRKNAGCTDRPDVVTTWPLSPTRDRAQLPFEWPAEILARSNKQQHPR